jgi:hypothetical protein
MLASYWSQRPGLNRRPMVYKTIALPLSYAGLTMLWLLPKRQKPIALSLKRVKSRLQFRILSLAFGDFAFSSSTFCWKLPVCASIPINISGGTIPPGILGFRMTGHCGGITCRRTWRQSLPRRG